MEPDTGTHTPQNNISKKIAALAAIISIFICMGFIFYERGITLHNAVESGDTSRVEKITQANPDAANSLGIAGHHKTLTPLHLAAENGNIEMAETLLRQGADPRTLSDQGCTPLHAAAQSGNIQMMGLLINAAGKAANGIPDDAAKTAYVNFAGNYMVMPLHTAAMLGQMEAAKLLLGHGAGINSRDAQGCTPLHMAVLARNAGMINMLLEKGAALDIADKEGKTPAACTMSNAAYTAKDILDLLLQKGASPDSPLCWAAYYNEQKMIKYLLDRKANINTKSGMNGWTALQVASSYGYKDTVKMLLDAGADPAVADKNGRTALKIAAQYGSYYTKARNPKAGDFDDVVKMLRAAGGR